MKQRWPILIVAHDATFVSAWNGLADLFNFHLRRYDKAEAAYRQAIAHDATFVSAWNGLGLLHFYNGDCESAIDDFQNGLEFEESPYLLMNLGHAKLCVSGEEARAEACELLRKALEGFDKSSLLKYDGNAFRLAMALSDHTLTAKHQLIVADLSKTRFDDVAWCLVLAALVEGSSAKIETAKNCYLEIMSSWFDQHELVTAIYKLAGFRPEVRESAAAVVRELLSLTPKITNTFRDCQMPAGLLNLYRSFGEGVSKGVGDPMDRAFFVRSRRTSTVST